MTAAPLAADELDLVRDALRRAGYLDNPESPAAAVDRLNADARAAIARTAADNARLRDALTALLAQHDRPESWADREMAVNQARRALAGRKDGDGRD